MEKKTKIFSKKEINSFRSSKYESLNWIKSEAIHQSHRKYMEQIRKEKGSVNLSNIIKAVFRKSIFGQYLKIFNEKQKQSYEINENKLCITEYDYRQYDGKEIQCFEKKNSPFENLYDLLKQVSQHTNVIDMNNLFENIKDITIRDANITITDNWIRNFIKLEALTLSANLIDQIQGDHLPRSLKLLELCDNNISSLEKLASNPPTKLLYLGLSRNGLKTKVSKFNRLGTNKTFRYLKVLDLSYNDIYTLEDLLQDISELQSLQSLTLIGNPCAVVQTYKDMVLNSFPNLLYLDDTKFLEDDRILTKRFKKGAKSAVIIFKCHRILALPAPPKEKNVKQTFHFEIDLPLLEEVHFDNELDDSNNEESNEKPKSKKSKVDSKKSAKGKKAFNPYILPNEYTPEFEKHKTYSFMTERIPWKKNIIFPPFLIKSPENDLRAVNDTFKSIVNVKLVYLKWLPPGKSGSKEKKKTKKDKGKNKGKNKGVTTDLNATEASKPIKEPQETILKRITLANYHCELSPINWSDDFIDFYWADNPQANPIAISVEGSLPAIIYGKPKKIKEKKGKGNNNEEILTKSKMQLLARTMKQPVPTIFTIQIGFGLKRTL